MQSANGKLEEQSIVLRNQSSALDQQSLFIREEAKRAILRAQEASQQLRRANDQVLAQERKGTELLRQQQITSEGELRRVQAEYASQIQNVQKESAFQIQDQQNKHQGELRFQQDLLMASLLGQQSERPQSRLVLNLLEYRVLGTLCYLADQLVENTVDIQEACRIAEKITVGTTRLVGGVPGRVLNSTGTIERELAELAAFVQKQSKEDPRRWAGTLMMIYAQLGAGNVGPVYTLIRRVVDVSGGICPPEATVFATAMVDALLSWSKFLHKDEI